MRQEEQSRDRPDLESSFQFFFVVYIDFIDVEFSVVFFCKLIEYRLQTFAIATPGSMKVYDTRFVAYVFPIFGAFFEVCLLAV